MNVKSIKIGKVDDLSDGEMKVVDVGEDHQILLAREHGEYRAVGAVCPHFGADMSEGTLCDGRVTCPWHHAVFETADGDLLEPPSLDALPTFPIHIEGEDLYLYLPEKFRKKRIPTMVQADPAQDGRVFVILGGGAAGSMAAQTLREEGFQGRIVLVTREDHPPYDRTNLSKGFLSGEVERKWLPLRSMTFFEKHQIELQTGKHAVKVSAKDKTVEFMDGSKLTYGTILLATGCEARRLSVDGAKLRNIFILRSLDDADAILDAASHAKRAFIVGASFIGLETAANLRARGMQVTVAAPEQIPFERIFGSDIGTLFRRKHEAQGVSFQLGRKIERFEGKGTVCAAVLDDGQRIECDLVVVGAGAIPSTRYIEDIELEADGGIRVDSSMKAAEHVFAAGDIASFPVRPGGERTRIEHWRIALQQGRIAARNMLGKAEPFEAVPFFWTRQAGLNLRSVGYAKDWNESHIIGDVESERFIAVYAKGGKVLAAFGNGRDREMAAIEELMRKGAMPTMQELKQGPIDFVKRLKG